MSPNKLKIQERIGKLKEYIEILKSYKHFSRQQIEEDKTIRGAVERYLYLAADISVSIAQDERFSLKGNRIRRVFVGTEIEKLEREKELPSKNENQQFAHKSKRHQHGTGSNSLQTAASLFYCRGN